MLAVNTRLTSALAVSFLVLVTFLCGCRSEGTVVWSTSVRSPDGQWLATAVTKQWSGPGNAYLATMVYLERPWRSRHPVEVLELSDGDASSGPGGSVVLTWLSPTHLDVGYDAHAEVDFQAVRLNDVEISVEDNSISRRK